MKPAKLVLAGVESGPCPCTGPECSQLRIEFAPGGRFEVHHPDPERARAVAAAVGELYAELVNDAVDRLVAQRSAYMRIVAEQSNRWRGLLDRLAGQHCDDPVCPPCTEWHRRQREEVIPDD